MSAAPPKYIVGFDEIRAISVLLVMLFHCEFLSFGWSGVQFFFVLSGYLITGQLMRDDRRPLGPALVDFFRRRALRLLPAYLLLVLVALIGSYAVGFPASARQCWAWLLTYTFNLLRARPIDVGTDALAHLWSLSVEVQFYFVWGLLVLWVRGRGIRQLAIGLVVLGPLVRWMTGILLEPSFGNEGAVARAIYMLPTSHADAFAWGAILAIVPLTMRWRRVILIGGPLLLAVGGVVTLLLARRSGLGWGWETFGYPIHTALLHQPVWSYSLLDFAAAAWVLRAREAPIDVAPWRRAVRRFGLVSYGIYLWHLPLLAVLRQLPVIAGDHQLRPWGFPLYVLLSWGVAEASFRWVERPFLKRKARTGRSS